MTRTTRKSPTRKHGPSIRAKPAAHPRPSRQVLENDPLFTFQRWRANLRILGIEEIKSMPYVPISHPFIESSGSTYRFAWMSHCRGLFQTPVAA
ncbi:MAG: hypothetical protein ACYC9L_14725 [Sulfuricaulis sp.]